MPILGADKVAALPRYTLRYAEQGSPSAYMRMVRPVAESAGRIEQTAKAGATSKMGQTLGSELLRSAIRWGTALGSTIGGISWLLGRWPGQDPQNPPVYQLGAASASGFYGTMTDEYAAGQVRNAPITQKANAQAQAEAYADVAPIYTQVAVQKELAIAQAKAEQYQALQPYYDSASETQKAATTKMPYTPRFL
jgi:hypothetical protein